MGVLHPYVDRRNTNEAVLKVAKPEKWLTDGEPLQAFSEDYLAARRTLFGQVLRATPEDSMWRLAF